jgi:hypothetical protein
MAYAAPRASRHLANDGVLTCAGEDQTEGTHENHLFSMQTGKPHRRIPAHLSHADFDESSPVELLISTEKRGGVVFLQIDEMTPPGS